MANDNNNVNELVADDDEQTAELEILDFKVHLHDDQERESDASTFDAFEEFEARFNGGVSVSDLVTDLRSRKKTISKLQYDIEQLHAKWLGLESEIKARESIADRLNHELSSAQDAINRQDRLLGKRDSKIKSLKNEIRQRQEENQTLLTEFGDLRQELSNANKALSDAPEPYTVLASDFALNEANLRLARADEYADTLRRQLQDQTEVSIVRENEHILQTQAVLDIKLEHEEFTERLLAAEKLAAELQSKFDESQARHEEEIRLLRFELTAAQESVAETDQLNSRLTSDLVDTRGFKDDLEKVLEKSERHSSAHISELQKQVGKLSKTTETDGEKLAAKGDAITELLDEREALTERLAAAEKLTEGLQSNRDEVQARHEEEIRVLRFDLSAAQESVFETGQLNSQLTSDLVDTRSLKEDLKKILEKSEKQSNARITELQNEISRLAKTTASDEEKIALKGEAISTLQGEREELTERLIVAEKLAEGLQSNLDEIQTRHDEEIRLLRFELTEAQESVVETGQLNSQLTSDLIDTRSFKDDLEKIIHTAEEQSNSRISDLQKKVSQLSKTAKTYEEKFAAKDQAITALLGELAKKSEQMESIGEIVEVVHEIDDRMSERFDGQSEQPKMSTENVKHTSNDRLTRVLVGVDNDQLLRFPLFKDRLTIGRADDNDIQLKAAYISRKHAVIQTDGEATRIIDWGSKNGIYVNSDRVKEHFLKNGDVVAMGNARFRYDERKKRDS